MNIKNKRTRDHTPPTDWRAQARALAMQSLAQLDIQGDDFLPELGDFIAEANIPSDSKTLAGELSRLAWTHREQCDQLIEQTVKHWQLQRIALIDRSILRLAITELLYRTEVPMKVVLDQAIELAKLFSTAESPQFVNGVLDAIARKIQEPVAAAEPEPNLELTGTESPVVKVDDPPVPAPEDETVADEKAE